MTQATDPDITELKTAIDGNTRAIAMQSDRIEAIGRGTEANTKAIETIAKATEANTQAIADLTLEMRVGFANVETRFAEVDVKFAELRDDIKSFDATKLTGFDQRLSTGEMTRRGVTIGVTVTVVGGLLLTFGKILFFGKIF
jgi:hypothetical protein